MLAWLLSTSFLIHAQKQDYHLKSYDTEIPMVIIVATYNNKDWYDRNLASIFGQKYENYRVIIIDDCSSDGTGDLIEHYIHEKEFTEKCTLIKNQQRCFKMANIYKAIHACPDNVIIVMLDGDDWFSDNGVLHYLNELYQSSNVWLTAGGYRTWPAGYPGICRAIPTEVIEQNNFRNYPQTTSQLRTFYAWLFKAIKLEDFFIHGHFIKTASDVAKMFPMFEMAAERIAYNYRKVYIYNRANVINDDKVDLSLQERTSESLCSKKKYSRLDQPMRGKENSVMNKTATVLVFAQNPTSLDMCLNSLKQLQGVDRVIVLCTDYQQFHDVYEIYKKQYNAQFIPFDPNSLNTVIRSLTSDYVMLVKSSTVISEPCSLTLVIRTLERTLGFAWYACSKGRSEFFEADEIDTNIYAFQFEQADKYMIGPFTLDGALYRKSTLTNMLNGTLDQPVTTDTIGIFSYVK